MICFIVFSKKMKSYYVFKGYDTYKLKNFFLPNTWSKDMHDYFLHYQGLLELKKNNIILYI